MTTSFKQILVHLDATPSCRARLEVAHRLARQHDAALNALYATTSSIVVMSYPDAATADLLVKMRELDAERRDRARVVFDAVAAKGGVSAAWAEVPEQPIIGIFAQQALFADLLVLGQHDPSSYVANEVPADFVEAVMADSGKAGLIIPYTGTFDRVASTIVIAWKDTREAARAVTAAMPLLQLAQQVHVLSWATQEGGVIGARLDLDSYLRRHGVLAHWHREPAEPTQVGDLLLSRSFDLGADLLVMGCYGHTRLREWVVGGTSRTVLRSMTLPVLMAH